MSEQFISEFFGLVKKSKPKHVEVCINKKQKDGRIDQLGFYDTTSKEYVIYADLVKKIELSFVILLTMFFNL